MGAPASHHKSKDVSVHKPEWTALTEVIEDNLSENVLFDDAASGAVRASRQEKRRTVGGKNNEITAGDYTKKIQHSRWKLKAGKKKKEKQASEVLRTKLEEQGVANVE